MKEYKTKITGWAKKSVDLSRIIKECSSAYGQHYEMPFWVFKYEDDFFDYFDGELGKQIEIEFTVRELK